MKKHSKRRLFLNFILTFVVFFTLSGFTTTVSMLMFLNRLELSFDYIVEFAPITFLNHLFISFLFSFIGTVWRSLTVERPVAAINAALLRIRKGDLTTKIKRRHYSSQYSTIVNNINLMTTELSSLDSLKGSLMSNISHELKTPISVINNYATLLQDPGLSEEKRTEYAKTITVSSKKMTELITNILKLNQLENQKIPTDLKEYDLSEQLCESLLNFEDVWEHKNIEIETDIEEEVYVTSDIQLMNIVWNNLFSNALKFTPKGGTISVSLTKGKRFAKVTVSDTGCGIPEDQLELIFDKFYQCDTSRGTDGNGLGLALVKRIINITDSFISVDSTLGKGTTFTVKIPIKK